MYMERYTYTMSCTTIIFIFQSECVCLGPESEIGQRSLGRCQSPRRRRHGDIAVWAKRWSLSKQNDLEPGIPILARFLYAPDAQIGQRKIPMPNLGIFGPLG